MTSLNTQSELKIFIGPVIHSEAREQVTIIQNAAVVVRNGKIEAVKELSDDSVCSKLCDQYPSAEVMTLKSGQFLIPGLIDTHIHAPQFPNVGLGYDKSLLEWLNSYTFPLESRYADTDFAKNVYRAVVKSTIHCGTTTAVYFGTIHRASCEVLAGEIHAAGQRALVGKVNMDTCCAPALLEDTATSVAETETYVEAVMALKSSLVRPVITPRFAVSCTAPLLAQLGKLAQKHDLHVQTHLAENKEEIKLVSELFPEATNYTDVYDQGKLLNRKTLLAHCIYLSDKEISVIKNRGCSVAHCPNSNTYIQSGLCDVRRLLSAGINVSLGTDVAGGSNPSILDAIRCALSTSISISFSQSGYKPLTYHEAFYLATMGGAKALDMEDELGNFAVGKYFDAIVVDTKHPGSPIHIFSELTLSELFQKFIYTGDDRNIHQVYVNGNLIKKSL